MTGARYLALVAATLMALVMHSHHVCHACFGGASDGGSIGVAVITALDGDGAAHECDGLCELEEAPCLAARADERAPCAPLCEAAHVSARAPHAGVTRDASREIRPPPLHVRTRIRARERSARRGSVQRR